MTGSDRAAAAVAMLLLAACSDSGPPQQAPPPPEVQVVTVKPHPISNIVEVPGRVQAVRTAEVRAQVDGIIRRRLYDEGTDVRAGQSLFIIDPREMRAQATAAEAALARAEATAANARQDVQRYEGLVEERAVSRQDYDAAVARLRTAEADVAQARAQVQAARLNLGYTTVTAPIAGRAGRAQVTEGALVSAAAATLLTTIEQIDTVYVNFSQSNAELLAIRREIRAGNLKVPTLDSIVVHVVLEDGTEYAHTGRLDFLDISVDQETGTTALRAAVPNPDRILRPGQFVRARIEAGVRPNGIAVPQRAVTVEPNAATVMVVTAGDTARARQVQLGPLEGDNWVVRDGLEPGDRVIVDGLQKVRPGQPVRVATG